MIKGECRIARHSFDKVDAGRPLVKDPAVHEWADVCDDSAHSDDGDVFGPLTPLRVDTGTQTDEVQHGCVLNMNLPWPPFRADARWYQLPRLPPHERTEVKETLCLDALVPCVDSHVLSDKVHTGESIQQEQDQEIT